MASGVQMACLSTFNPDETPGPEHFERFSQLVSASWTFERDTSLRTLLHFGLPFQVASRQLRADQLEPVRLAMRDFRPTAVVAMQHYTFALASLFANAVPNAATLVLRYLPVGQINKAQSLSTCFEHPSAAPSPPHPPTTSHGSPDMHPNP